MNDAPTAITRMLELGVALYLIKAASLGVMAQRLVRTFQVMSDVLSLVSPYALYRVERP
jgi:general secretion pathway protein E